jgi:single-strand DNA-binding protein
MNELIATVLRASQHRFIGRLARDPEVRYFESGKSVCNVRILINRPGAKRDDGQEPDGFKLELWNDLATSFADAHRKGDLCDVSGRVKSESWEDKSTGETRTGLVVMVDDWQPVGGKAPAKPAPQAAAAPAAAAKPAQDWNSGWEGDDEEAPF